MDFRIFTCSINETVLQNNLLRSSFIIKNKISLWITRGKHNIPAAFNHELRCFAEIVPLEKYDFLMFVHDDVFLPEEFEAQLTEAMAKLPENWGVLGVAGVIMENGVRKLKGNISDRGKNWGKPINGPEEVQTVDELLVIVNPKAYEIGWDEQFPLDFYAADLCLQAKDHGYGVYVIPAYVHHNSSRGFGQRTPSFFESEKRMREKWKWIEGPIVTTCSIVK